MTKDQIAHELVKVGLVIATEVKSIGEYDASENIIIHYLLYPGDKGPQDDDWLEAAWIISLEEALFLAGNCSTLDQWINALARESLHSNWKLLQATDRTGLSAEELQRHREVQQEIEQVIESNEFGQGTN
jgi:hypothetical protein